MKEKENDTTVKELSNKDIPVSESLQILGTGGDISNEAKTKIPKSPQPNQNLISISLIKNENNSQNDLNIFDIDDDFLNYELCTSITLGNTPILQKCYICPICDNETHYICKFCYMSFKM